jgi:hypothetical protein
MRGQFGSQNDRAAARTATAMRRREGLVQVQVQRIDAEFGRPYPADNRVEIGSVAIEESPGGVHRFGDVEDFVLEQAAGVRIGQHQRRDIGTERRLQRGQVDPALVPGPFGIRRNRLDGVAASGGGRRVGAVRRFRHQDAAAPIAARLERGADRHDAA